MEIIKIAHFEREHGQGTFPWYRHLHGEQLEEVIRSLTQLLCLPAAASSSAIVRNLQQRSQTIEGANAADEGFELAQVLSQAGLSVPDEMYVNWDNFGNVDLMQSQDVILYFDELWYPGSDDVDLFDRGMSWIMTITHYGAVSLVRFAGT